MSNQLANELVKPVYSSCATWCLCIFQTLRHRFVNTSVNHVANGLVKHGISNSVSDVASLVSARCLLCRCLKLCFLAWPTVGQQWTMFFMFVNDCITHTHYMVNQHLYPVQRVVSAFTVLQYARALVIETIHSLILTWLLLFNEHVHSCCWCPILSVCSWTFRSRTLFLTRDQSP